MDNLVYFLDNIKISFDIKNVIMLIIKKYTNGILPNKVLPYNLLNKAST